MGDERKIPTERGSSGYCKVQIAAGDTREGDTVDRRGLEKEADQDDCCTNTWTLDRMNDDRLCVAFVTRIGKCLYRFWSRTGAPTTGGLDKHVGLGRVGKDL